MGNSSKINKVTHSNSKIEKRALRQQQHAAGHVSALALVTKRVERLVGKDGPDKSINDLWCALYSTFSIW